MGCLVHQGRRRCPRWVLQKPSRSTPTHTLNGSVMKCKFKPTHCVHSQVFRILGVLREVALPDPSQGALAPKPGVAAPAPDAYKVLGVDTSTPSAEVKKRYMRLSLLIHPDKCKHKDAHEAFQAVAKAAKTLQDSSARQVGGAPLQGQCARERVA